MPCYAVRRLRRTPHALVMLWLLVAALVAVLDQPAAAVYVPPNRQHKRVAQTVTVVLSNVHDLMFCRACDDPLTDGAIVIPQRLHAASDAFSVRSELVFAIPNDGAYALYNAHELVGNVAVFTRGAVSVAHKARVAQRAGAVAVIVMDAEDCDPETMHCHRTVSVSAQGESERQWRSTGPSRRFDDDDPPSVWLPITIPVAMVSADDAARIRSAMDLVVVDVNGEPQFFVGV